jgi:hypothetical protein
MGETWREAWRSALDELELTLEHTERLLSGETVADEEPPAWTPPAVSGPVPTEFAVRARLLLGRQQALISETLTARVGVRQKLELLDKLTGARRGARDEQPVYVDLTA